MKETLNPGQALLLVRLLFLGGEEPYALSKMKPQLLKKAAERQELIDRGLLEKQERPVPPKSVLVPTDRAWDWLADHLCCELPPVPKNQAQISKLYGELFSAMLTGLARSIERGQVSLAEFAVPDAFPADATLSPEEDIVAAYRRLSEGIPHAAVRIAAIQDALKYPCKEVNAILLAMARAEKILLHPCDTPSEATSSEWELMPVLSGVVRHTVTMAPLS